MERITEFTPAYDKRNPDPSQNYGIHCVDLRMILKGERGAVQFVLYTGWYPKHLQKEMPNGILPADLGYHSHKPMWDGQPAQENCRYLDGKPCYYDGSGLNAERIFDILLEEGGEAVWKELEEYYIELFGELK